MPRINRVSLVGIVSDYPCIKRNKNDEIVETAVTLMTIHGKRDYGERQITHAGPDDIKWKGYDNVTVITSDYSISERIQECKPYDIVEVEGAVRVETIKKKCYCPECGAVHRFRTSRASVYPIYLMQRIRTASQMHIDLSRDLSEEDETKLKAFAFKFLERTLERSNTVLISGAIIKEPALYMPEKNSRPELEFPIISYRHYYVKEDDMSVNVDAPWVKVYGKYAYEEAKYLTMGNVVLIDGFLQSRDIVRKRLCENCGVKFPVTSDVLNVVAYSIEHLRANVNEPSGFVKKEEKAKHAQMIGTEAHVDVQHKPFVVVDGEVDSEVLENLEVTPIQKDIIDAVIKEGSHKKRGEL